MDRKLHIGGRIAAPGWEILDIYPGPHVDHVGNANGLVQFAEATFAEIYASHVLEHFDYQDELLLTLQEWLRVLRPGGMLRVSVTDLDILAHLMLQKHQLDVEQRFQVMRMIFGGHTNAHDYHLVGLNEDLLKLFLDRAGFVNLRRVSRHALFDDTSNTVVAGTLISLNMTAQKPGNVQIR